MPDLPPPTPPGVLYSGDNLAVLRGHVADSTVDLCYVDPPFFSRRDYALRPPANGVSTQAFTDRWIWAEQAASDYRQIQEAPASSQTDAAKALLRGLLESGGEGPLLAYLVNLTLRLAEIWRVLAAHGTLYVHLDASAAHYVKLICDALFLPRGGEFRNEIVWGYASGGRATRDFAWKHDTILRYTKSARWTFHAQAIQAPRTLARRNHMKREIDSDGRVFRSIRSAGKIYRYYEDESVTPSDVWTDLSHLHQRDPERTGYPTQKPEALLARIIAASSHPGDLVLDAYCGSGTTLAAAQKLGRRWIGIDQSPAAIAATRQRLASLTPSAAVPADVPPDAPTTRDSQRSG